MADLEFRVWRDSQPPDRTESLRHFANLIFVGSVFGYYWLYYHDSDVLWIWTMIVGFVLAYCLGSNWLQFLLSFRLLQHLGMVSYSVFLLHFPITDYLGPTFRASLSGWPTPALYLTFFSAVLASSWLLSSLTHRLVELPGIALGDD